MKSTEIKKSRVAVERKSVDLYCKNKTQQEKIEKQVRTIEIITVPIFTALFFTILPFFVLEFFSRFTIVFLVSFVSFLTIYLVKKNFGLPNGDFNQKTLEIVIKSTLNALGISIYLSVFLFGESQPLFVFDPVENVLIIGLTTLIIDVGLWATIWILAVLLSKFVVKKM